MGRATLDDILDNRSNSFNAVRLMAALAVFVSHGFLIVPIGNHSEPLDGAAFNLGQIAVNIFFFLSGLMLSRSFALKPHLASFVAARMLRIFPGLVVCGLVTALLVGPLNTTLGLDAYFRDPATVFYPFKVLLQVSRVPLPGVFTFGMEPGEINVPLWTIKYELLAYSAFLAIPILGLFGSRRFAGLAVVLLGGLLIVSGDSHAFDTSLLGSLIRFGFCFALGMLAFLYRKRIKPSWPGAIFLVIVAFYVTSLAFGEVMSVVAFAYLAVTLGATSLPVVTRLTNRADISYGLYLYSFPIQQAAIAKYGTTLDHAIYATILAATFAILLATLSWFYVEKPALSLKKAMARSYPPPTPMARQ
jgi:peptidoglycan/LPS O-acetylase OafA/YrhL